MRLRKGAEAVVGGGGSWEMGMYMRWREGLMEPGGWRGLRRERRKHGFVAAVMIVGLPDLVGWAISAHETRNMFAE